MQASEVATQSLSVPQLLKIAQELRAEIMIELHRLGIRIQYVNEKGETIPDLTPYQKDCFDTLIIAAFTGNEEIAWLITRQAGKTEVVILGILTLVILDLYVLGRSSAVGIFAPARSQAIEVDRERLRERTAQLTSYLARHGIRHDTTVGRTTKNFYFYRDPFVFLCRMESADPEANIKGSTMPLIILEQAEDIDPMKLKTDILPMGAAVAGSVLYSGTPSLGIPNPYFYDLCTKRAGSSDVIIVDWKQASKYRPEYKAYVEKQMERMGEDDPAFRTQYCLEWIPGLAKFTTLEEVQKHQIPYEFDLVYKRRGSGVDWAKEIDDTYGCALERCNDAKHPDKHGLPCQHLHLIALHEEHGLDYTIQVPNLVEFTKLWRITRTVDDARGVGDPLNEQLTGALRGISDVTGLDITVTVNDNVSKLFQREWQEGRFWLPTPETYDLPCYQAILTPEARQNQKKMLKKFINQLLDLQREYKNNALNLKHPEGQEFHDDAVKAVVYGVFGSIGLIGVQPPAAYATFDTQKATGRDQEEETLKEVARSFDKPMSMWGEL